MKKTYSVEIDCASCASRAEEAIRKMDEVDSCSVNYMMKKLTINYKDGVDPEEAIKKVKKTAQKAVFDFEIL